jgi:hypothetical protein
MKDIVSNCLLCEEHSLHVMGKEEAQIMQCISCGYVTSTKYIGPKETNEEYKKLQEEMKNWAVEKNDRIWIPTVITLPFGMLYPIDENSEMKWAFAPMVEIPEEEKENYKNKKGSYYEKRIDTDKATIYNTFLDGMVFINKQLKIRIQEG